MSHEAAQERERKLNLKLLRIITQCAENDKPLPTHEQISITLKVKIHNIARGIRVLIREKKITRTGTRSKYTYRVNLINKTTAPCNRSPVVKSKNPKPELREPSDPPRLKWLDKADAALKRIDDNWGPVKERFDVLRATQERLDASAVLTQDNPAPEKLVVRDHSARRL